MGFALSWIAVKGHSAQGVQAALGVRPTGKREELPESDLTGAQLSTELYLVVFNREELPPAKLSEYSSSFELIYGFVEEHVMYCTVAAWQSGKELWSVVHDAQEGILHLAVNGTPPTSFAAIRDRLVADQKIEDSQNPKVDHIFDIPVELAKELTGYRYDRDIERSGTAAFEVLEPVKTSWLGKLFRK